MLIAPAQAASYADYRRLAKRRLPRFLFDYIEGAAGDELTAARNEADFAALNLRQRVLVDVQNVSTHSRVLGEAARLPLALAPIGMAGLYHRRGEAQAAQAAQRFGVPFSLSTVGICSFAEVQQASGAPCWFQLYMLRDRGVVTEVLKRLWAQGCRTLLFTVDLPLAGVRRRDRRNGMLGNHWSERLSKALQLAASPLWLYQVGIQGKPHRFDNLAGVGSAPADLNHFKEWIDRQFDPSVTWADIAWLRQQWPGTLVLKGLLDGEDVNAALDSGADALIVSNHGGRQLDGAPSTISCLAQLASRADRRLPLLLDGGVRSGADIFKALAQGAQAVLIGRPWAFALAGAGEAGVHSLLCRLEEELRLSMALCGVTRTEQIGLQHLHLSPSESLKSI